MLVYLADPAKVDPPPGARHRYQNHPGAAPNRKGPSLRWPLFDSKAKTPLLCALDWAHHVHQELSQASSLSDGAAAAARGAEACGWTSGWWGEGPRSTYGVDA